MFPCFHWTMVIIYLFCHYFAWFKELNRALSGLDIARLWFRGDHLVNSISRALGYLLVVVENYLNTVPAVPLREVFTSHNLHSPDTLGSGVTRLTMVAATSLFERCLFLSKMPLIWLSNHSNSQHSSTNASRNAPPTMPWCIHADVTNNIMWNIPQKMWYDK